MRERLLFAEIEICIYTNSHHFLGSSLGTMGLQPGVALCSQLLPYENRAQGIILSWCQFPKQGLLLLFLLSAGYQACLWRAVGTPNVLPCPGFFKGIGATNTSYPIAWRLREWTVRCAKALCSLTLGDGCYPNPTMQMSKQRRRGGAGLDSSLSPLKTA